MPLFLPCTPDSKLVRQLREVEERSSVGRPVRFRFVETAGTSFKSLLQKSDPWASKKCGEGDCFPCMGEKGGNCRRSNVSYQIVCQECGEDQVIAHYKGETSRNMYTRGLEHLGQLKSKKTDSPLWSHC